MDRQHTLAASASLTGVGVHSGAPATLTVRPAGPGTGVVFVRADKGGARIPASLANVTATMLGTDLAGEGGASVSTVEHFLAACAGLGVDNVLAEIDGPELPIMDGSAEPFAALLAGVGLVRQAEPRRLLRILRPVEVQNGPRIARLAPDDGFTLAIAIDFATPVIGSQSLELTLAPGVFRRDIAWARTFGFAADAAKLHAMGRGLGASLENTIVIEGERVLNPGGLKAPDEFVRHKLLDVIGDLALAGAPIVGRYEASQPGHALNTQLLRAVLDNPRSHAWEQTLQG